MTRHDSGFTLFELTFVLLLLGMLVAIAVPTYAVDSHRVAAATCLANRTIIERSAQTYRSIEGTIAPSIGAMVGKYLVSTPKCPTLGTYVWRAAESTVLCSIHFAGEDATLWTSNWSDASLLKTILGKWAPNGGLLTTTSSASQALFTAAVPNDFSLRVGQISLSSGSGYGLYFRATESAAGLSGYCFQYDPGLGNKFVVRKVTGGKESGPIATASMPSGYAVYGTSRAVSITSIGSHTVIKVDGVPVLDFTDATFTSGQVGLRSWNSSSVSVGGVSVSKAVP